MCALGFAGAAIAPFITSDDAGNVIALAIYGGIVIALSAAVLIGVQFWHGDRGGVYVLWYLPLLLLMVFRPNLSAHEPPVPAPGGGLVVRWAKAGWRRLRPGRTAPSPTELAV